MIVRKEIFDKNGKDISEIKEYKIVELKSSSNYKMSDNRITYIIDLKKNDLSFKTKDAIRKHFLDSFVKINNKILRVSGIEMIATADSFPPFVIGLLTKETNINEV